MLIRIGYVEIEIEEGRVKYDALTGTLDLQPQSYSNTPLRIVHEKPTTEKRRADINGPPAKKLGRPVTIGPKPKNIPVSKGAKKEVLKAKVLEIVNASPHKPSSMQGLTILCLGLGSSEKEKKYLKHMLEDMVAAGDLQLVSGIRRAFLPAKPTSEIEPETSDPPSPHSSSIRPAPKPSAKDRAKEALAKEPEVVGAE